jgi:hypothetical protein
MTGELLFTKTIVNKKDVRAFQRILFKHGFGYELALDMDKSFRKLKGQSVAFFIDSSGYITYIEDYDYYNDDHYREYSGCTNEEVSWEYYFDGLGEYA